MSELKLRPPKDKELAGSRRYERRGRPQRAVASDEKRKGKLETRRQKLERDKRKTSTFDPEKSKPQVEKTLPGAPGESCWESKVYRRHFVSTRLAATLLVDGATCFALCACPALVIKRDCSYISIHFWLEIAEISLPIASSGKSSGDSK